MKRNVWILWLVIMMWQIQAIAQTQTHPRQCGLEQLQAAMIAKDATWADRFKAQKDGMQAIVDNYIAQKNSGALERTSATISPVPIIFHIVVDSAQYNALGGMNGIGIRCDSQIAVLNRDYNRENPDSGDIPSSWKPLYGKPGIQFGLARTDPNGNCTPGYEVMIIPGSTTYDAGFSNIDSTFPEAKTAGTGLPAWDVTKYYNVWCINFTGGASNLLGLTVPLSFTGVGGWPVDWEGACILYNTLGCTAWDSTSLYGTGDWFVPFNLGRTLTHETGHMFEIWHPWGDDDGKCPWNQTGTSCTPGIGSDDGLSDTPPQSNWTYNAPAYTIPGGTINDCCQMDTTANMQPKGIACLSFLDYTNDNAMHMFTTEQAAAMASMVLVPPDPNIVGATGKGGYMGENYSLTQHPELLVCNSSLPLNVQVSIYPNPSTGIVNISVAPSPATISQIVVTNILGQLVLNMKSLNDNFYSIDLSGMSAGIYFVRCNFVTGTVTRKILIQ